MTQPLIGMIQGMKIVEKNADYWVLENHLGKATLPTKQMHDYHDKTTVTVFLYRDKDEAITATCNLPKVEVGTFGWGKITEINDTGAFVDIGTDFNILLPKDDLPTVEAVWPEVGTAIYLRLKKDSKGRLLAIPAKAHELDDLFIDASKMNLNDEVSGWIVQVGREGSVMYTSEGYRGFIHDSERGKEPRLGAQVSGRVIEVKEDGSLNISLLPLKHERMDDDAAKILAYLEAHDGEIPIGNKSDPTLIKNTFGMSKAAFKRAVGRLFKQRKIIPEDERIVQVTKNE